MLTSVLAQQTFRTSRWTSSPSIANNNCLMRVVLRAMFPVVHSAMFRIHWHTTQCHDNDDDTGRHNEERVLHAKRPTPRQTKWPIWCVTQIGAARRACLWHCATECKVTGAMAVYVTPTNRDAVIMMCDDDDGQTRAHNDVMFYFLCFCSHHPTVCDCTRNYAGYFARVFTELQLVRSVFRLKPYDGITQPARQPVVTGQPGPNCLIHSVVNHSGTRNCYRPHANAHFTAHRP